MPTHILIPTDGSELSAKAAAYGMDLAKKLGAKVTAITVTAPPEAILLGEGVLMTYSEVYEQHAAKNARKTLEPVLKMAAEAGVACEGIDARDDEPWHGILETAKSKGVDLIIMASHGRRGLAKLMLGSQTQRVTSHTEIPVLVYRAPDAE